MLWSISPAVKLRQSGFVGSIKKRLHRTREAEFICCHQSRDSVVSRQSLYNCLPHQRRCHSVLSQCFWILRLQQSGFLRNAGYQQHPVPGFWIRRCDLPSYCPSHCRWYHRDKQHTHYDTGADCDWRYQKTGYILSAFADDLGLSDVFFSQTVKLTFRKESPICQKKAQTLSGTMNGGFMHRRIWCKW